MQSFSVKCHRPGAAVLPATFFILSRGKNAGRPAYTPSRNCFALRCRADDLEPYYWLVFALWQTGAFAALLMGTAIPFLRLRDLRTCIATHQLRGASPERLCEQLAAVTALEAKLRAQLALLPELRRAILANAVSRLPDDSPPSIFSLINTTSNDKEEQDGRDTRPQQD